MKRRYKLLLILVISFILVITIYLFLKKPHRLIVSIGYNMLGFDYVDCLDQHYDDSYTQIYKINIENHNLASFLEYMKDTEIAYNIKNADLLIINFGTLELNNYKEVNDSIIIDYLNNAYQILSQIRHLNRKDIYLINLYDSKQEFVNRKFYKYASEFKMHYFDRSFIPSSYIYDINGKMILSYEGHKKVADAILHS